MSFRRIQRFAMLVATAISVPGCAGLRTPSPVASNGVTPELQVEMPGSAESPAPASFYGQAGASHPPYEPSFAAARPIDARNDSTVRGQTPSGAPNYWSDYQSSRGYGAPSTANAPANAPIAGSSDRYRQPMSASGAPAGSSFSAAPSYGAGSTNGGASYGGSPAPGSGTSVTPVQYGGGAPVGALPGGGTYSSADGGAPVVGGMAPPGNMVVEPIFPPDVIPPSAADGLQPLPDVPVDVLLSETRTGRFMFGVGVNSDAGVSGQIVLDERNFDLFNPPTSWAEFRNGTAWRGGGQGLRLEAMPGNQVQRYTASLTDPYLFGVLPYSFNISGFLFDRIYRDWSEQRFGGRVALGDRLTPDLSLAIGVRGEQVDIRNPRVAGVPELDAVLGESDLFGGSITLTRDTRDMPFSPTQGSLVEATFEQMFGDYDFPRGSLDVRQYFLVRERPDGSGRHTLGFSFRTAISGTDTPLFENYFAGGFSTLRGFSFRGASPLSGGVIVGGRFLFTGSVEYMFPLTADDMIKGVVFTDFGTVEQDIRFDKDTYRVAPGFGLRVAIPALGPAPLAFDFAFPVAYAETDDRQVFSFFFGFGR